MVEIVDTLGRDAGSGPAIWRLGSLAALSSVMFILGPLGSAVHELGGESAGGLRSALGKRPAAVAIAGRLGLDAVAGGAGSATSDFRELYGSHAYVQALQVLLQRGHLQTVLGVMGANNVVVTRNSSSTSACSMTDVSEPDEGLILSTLSFCTQMATSVEGTEALLSCGIMQRLVGMRCFQNPPPFPR